MEYASNGELFDKIVQKVKLPEREAAEYFKQIVYGVDYLNSIGFVHRDLKPENLLLENKQVKIVDFGLGNIYKAGRLLDTACGSPCYACPEMIEGKSYQPVMVDIWSCGIILFAMLCGYLPFEVMSLIRMRTQRLYIRKY